jgi:hypothetical protein
MFRRLISAVALIGAAAFAAPAAAQESVYTSLDLAACAQMPAEGRAEQPNVWVCDGYAGYWVLVLEAEGRFYVSYARYFPEAQPAVYETLEPLSNINDVLEWRLDAAGNPVATILRFFVHDTGTMGGGEGQVLVVTKLDPEACHIAYIDAGAVADANVLAREVADLVPRGFACMQHSPLFFALDDEPGMPLFDLPGTEPPVISDEIRDFVRLQLGA